MFTENCVTVWQKEDFLANKPIGILITCEHGGNRIPRRFSSLFLKSRDILDSHEGYDPGALGLAKRLSEGTNSPLFFSTIARLLIDLNRSPRNPKRFSEITRHLSIHEKTLIQKLYFEPYRNRVQTELIRSGLKSGQVLHLSVHSFTPVLHGQIRTADLGLLYDPSRKAEAAFCIVWQRILNRLAPRLELRRNYPYRGSSDGFTSYLRRHFPEDTYMGIELEANQKYLSGNRRVWLGLQQMIVTSLDMTRKVWSI